MKKIVLMCLVALTAVFSGCAKSNSGNAGNAQNQPSREDPEIAKIDIVLSQMSDRAQRELVITDKKQFLKDLHAVLDFEKNNKSEDIGLFYLIDKKHNIGSEYVPVGLIKLTQNDLFNISRNDLSLRPEAYENLKVLSQAALNDGIKLMVSSTYRSYDYQDKLFARWVKIDGLAEAERESARPGTSQHQLGVAIDFGNIEDSFIETKMGQWLDKNARFYGWSLSFPKNYEDITGYRWECWHYRYIGIPACELQYKYFLGVQQYMLEFIDLWKNI